MSRVPYWLPSLRWGARMNHTQVLDALIGGLGDPFEGCHMGITAENIAERWKISREEQDEYAVESHRRAAQAIAEGRFQSQILPVEIKQRKKTITFDTDEHVRAEVTLADMAKLKPAFDPEGSVTPGNASGINDAAAAVVLMERSVAEQKGLKPLARLVGYAVAGVEPEIMGIGPVPAVRQLLEKSGLSVADLDVIELNEAFAAQVLAVLREWKLPNHDNLNVNGSGISLGHPIAATGARILTTLLNEMERQDAQFGLETMCVGGGQGVAAMFERR